MAEQKRVMGLDVGDKRVGVALSDPSGMIAQPHCTLAQRGERVIHELLKIAQEKNVEVIVVGFPRELDGSVGMQARKVESFVKLLQSRIEAHPALSSTKTVMWDERMTSVEAARVLSGSGLKNQERRSATDRIAAALILESYLNSRP